MMRSAFSRSGRTKRSRSAVYRGSPWKATAKAPTTKYSTPFAFNNPTNSRKSLFSGIGMAAVAQFDQNPETLLGGHAGISTGIGCVSIGKARKYADNFLHLSV